MSRNNGKVKKFIQRSVISEESVGNVRVNTNRKKKKITKRYTVRSRESSLFEIYLLKKDSVTIYQFLWKDRNLTLGSASLENYIPS